MLDLIDSLGNLLEVNIEYDPYDKCGLFGNDLTQDLVYESLTSGDLTAEDSEEYTDHHLIFVEYEFEGFEYYVSFDFINSKIFIDRK